MENFIDFYVPHFLVIAPLVGVIYSVFEQIDCKAEASSIALFLLYPYILPDNGQYVWPKRVVSDT
jgi:hypothetical protein